MYLEKDHYLEFIDKKRKINKRSLTLINWTKCSFTVSIFEDRLSNQESLTTLQINWTKAVITKSGNSGALLAKKLKALVSKIKN